MTDASSGTNGTHMNIRQRGELSVWPHLARNDCWEGLGGLFDLGHK